MKNSTQDIESILATAEKFFNKGNYQQAKKQFELAGKTSDLKGVKEKILVCDQELQSIRAKDLLKRARKHAGKEHSQKALQCFEKAYQITREDWIREKIEELQAGVANQDAYASAQKAEMSGEFLQAAKLYEQASAVHSLQDMFLRKACCLAKAENYEEAIEVYQQLDTLDCEASYYYGFSLAKMGRYYECLQAWERLNSQPTDFIVQKKNVQSLLTVDLYDRLKRNEDFAEIYPIAKYLQDTTTDQNLADLVDVCRYALIQKLWVNEQYEAIQTLLNDASLEINKTIIDLYAKTSFKLAETSGNIVGLSLYWLNAVFNLEPEKPITREAKDKIRQKLLCQAEALISKVASSGKESEKNELIIWSLEKALLNDLYSLFADQESFAHLLLTPRLARKQNKSDEILQFIQDHQQDFSEKEASLKMGSYYSLSMQSLYHLEQAAYEKSIACLTNENARNEFEEYGMQRVNFVYGQYCLESGKSWPKKLINTAISWFELSPSEESTFINKALGIFDEEKLLHYEEFLTAFHKRRSSASIGKLLSTIMSRRVMILHNSETISPKIAQAILKKALQLDPDNELAHSGLKFNEIVLKTQEIDTLFNRCKFNKASKIASQSEHQEVRDHFFQFIDAITDEDHLDRFGEERNLFLKECYECTVTVDPYHPVAEKISDLLEGSYETIR